MGCQSIKSTTDRSWNQIIGPWAKLCCYMKKPPNHRMCYHHRGDLPETGTRWSRRVKGRSQGHLKEYPPPQQNITKEEQKVIAQLRRYDTRIVLTADKGVALVVMKKEDYEKKAEELLNQTTYKNITNDPTTRYINKLINILKTIKTQGGISQALYRKLYTTGAGSPKIYGLPKIHRKETWLRPKVSSIGAVSYASSKELARILKHWLVGLHIMYITIKTSWKTWRDLNWKKEEHLMSFDVKALFTSVPIQPAIQITEKLLGEDQGLKQRTSISVDHIVCLLEFCLRSTYFTFKGRFLWATRRCSNVLSHQPNCCKLVYGGPRNQDHRVIAKPTIILEKICGWDTHHHEGITSRKLPEPP